MDWFAYDFDHPAYFEIEDVFGGLHGGPWQRDAERWIYRAIRQ